MDRKEILEAYKVNEHGIITSPGKFEGDMLYAPYFWDSVLNGLADRETEDPDGTLTAWFDVNEADRAEFPELTNVVTIGLWESDQGFVYHTAA